MFLFVHLYIYKFKGINWEEESLEKSRLMIKYDK